MHGEVVRESRLYWSLLEDGAEKEKARQALHSSFEGDAIGLERWPSWSNACFARMVRCACYPSPGAGETSGSWCSLSSQLSLCGDSHERLLFNKVDDFRGATLEGSLWPPHPCLQMHM